MIHNLHINFKKGEKTEANNRPFWGWSVFIEPRGGRSVKPGAGSYPYMWPAFNCRADYWLVTTWWQLNLKKLTCFLPPPFSPLQVQQH